VSAAETASDCGHTVTAVADPTSTVVADTLAFGCLSEVPDTGAQLRERL